MTAANLRLIAAVAAALLGLAGAGAVIALPPAPAPLSPGGQPPKADEPPPRDLLDPGDPPPSAFPDLKPPELPKRQAPEDPADFKRQMADFEHQLARLCPRLFGAVGVAIDPADDTYRRLLKARLHQGVLAVRGLDERARIGNIQPEEYLGYLVCVQEVRAVVLELWPDDPKQLIPWLEEFVILTKMREAGTAQRVRIGTDPLYANAVSRRHRLAAEAALWKAKNAPRPGGAGGPAPKVAGEPPAEKPVGGDWTPKAATDPVPTAFPNLEPPDRKQLKGADYEQALEKLCPRLFGREPVGIDPADGIHRRLLKARLHQAVLEFRGLYLRVRIGAGVDEINQIIHAICRCTEEVRAVVLELWPDDPRQLIPWLEESVILIKEWEAYGVSQAKIGSAPWYRAAMDRRYRLEAEAALWKAKNAPRPDGAGGQPPKAAEKPIEGTGYRRSSSTPSRPRSRTSSCRTRLSAGRSFSRKFKSGARGCSQGKRFRSTRRTTPTADC